VKHLAFDRNGTGFKPVYTIMPEKKFYNSDFQVSGF